MVHQNVTVVGERALWVTCVLCQLPRYGFSVRQHFQLAQPHLSESIYFQNTSSGISTSILQSHFPSLEGNCDNGYHEHLQNHILFLCISKDGFLVLFFLSLCVHDGVVASVLSSFLLSTSIKGEVSFVPTAEALSEWTRYSWSLMASGARLRMLCFTLCWATWLMQLNIRLSGECIYHIPSMASFYSVLI